MTMNQREITESIRAAGQTKPRPALLPLGAMLTSMVLSPALAHGAGTEAASAAEQTLPTVHVRDRRDEESKGYQGGTTRVGKLKQLPKDVPQALTVVPEQLMTDTNSNTLKEALRHVSGLTFNAAEGGRIGDNFNLRGFYSFGDLYMDGIRDVAQINRETFNLEQVDVLRGSAAMLFGRGQAGGVINQVSKPAMLDDRGTVTATAGNFDYKRVTVDINKPLGDEVAIRLNAMKTDAGSSRNHVKSERNGFAPTIGFGIGSDNEFSLGYYHLKVDNIPDYGVRFFNRKPLDIPASRSFVTTSDYEINKVEMTTANYKHAFSPETEVRTVLRAADYERELWAATMGNVPASGWNDATVVTRGRQARGGSEHTLTSQTDFTTKFEVAGLKHEVLTGLEWLRERAGRWNYNSPAVVAPATTIGAPDNSPVLPALYGHRIRSGINTYTGYTTAFYAQDMVEFTPGWKLLLGMRRDDMRARYSNGANVEYAENSYRTGLSWQPDDYRHYYLTISDSFSPTADLYQFTSATVIYDPERSRSLEIGGKWELYEGDLSLRAALYRAVKYWERNTDVESAATATILTERRHTDGFELEAAGRITSKWDVFAGLTLMRALIDKQAPGRSPGYVGMRPRNTPPYAFNLWSTYKLNRHWKVGGGVEAAGDRLAYGLGNAATAAAPVSNIAPRYQRFDAMVEYALPGYALRLNVLNLLDKRYYAAVYENGGFALPGTERTFQLTFTYKY
jgi:catecholate siderophore receptor